MPHVKHPLVIYPGKRSPKKKIPDQKVPWEKVLEKNGPRKKRYPCARFLEFGECVIVGWALSTFWCVWGHQVGLINKNTQIVQLPSVNFLIIPRTENAFSGTFTGDHFSGELIFGDLFPWRFSFQGTFFPGTFFSAYHWRYVPTFTIFQIMVTLLYTRLLWDFYSIYVQSFHPLVSRYARVVPATATQTSQDRRRI